MQNLALNIGWAYFKSETLDMAQNAKYNVGKKAKNHA